MTLETKAESRPNWQHGRPSLLVGVPAARGDLPGLRCRPLLARALEHLGFSEKLMQFASKASAAAGGAVAWRLGMCSVPQALPRVHAAFRDCREHSPSCQEPGIKHACLHAGPSGL